MNIQFGIVILFGKFGAGKGTTNTMLALNEMHNEEDYENSCLKIDELEKKFNRKFTKPPQKHVVFSNYDIADDEFKAYDFDIEKFMMPNSEFNYNLLVPYASVHLEEGQSGVLSAYDWSKMPAPALLAFTRVRHPKYKFIIDLQFLENLNVNLRRYALCYLTPLNLEHTYDCFNNISKTISYCGVFYSYEKAKKFEDSKDLTLIDEINQYEYYGCVYDCFDSYSQEIEFFKNSENKDFVYSLKEIKNIKNIKKTNVIEV